MGVEERMSKNQTSSVQNTFRVEKKGHFNTKIGVEYKEMLNGKGEGANFAKCYD